MPFERSLNTSKRRRLVVVDDVPDNLTVLTVLLSRKYAVFGFSSCREALVALRTINPDLLALDVGMFPISGVDFLREVRMMQEFRDIPAIAITAFARDEEKQTFLAAGFQAIVTKPIIDPAGMELMIDGLLNSTHPECRVPLDETAGRGT